ncbi:unnamed protein product [Nyctereutes procyonoides]|uniref:(raccoon dog) hypothetical protein n=1 Tax=Nyctereutes procyonoides TaxID=34880 RepID=A0A811YMG2_NYCPR|nr:unnamed protein product [Nyctereutes procyonoides]
MEQTTAQTEVMLGPLQGHPWPHSEGSGPGQPQPIALKQFRRSQGGRGRCSRGGGRGESNIATTSSFPSFPGMALRARSSPSSTSQKHHPGILVAPRCPLTAQSGPARATQAESHSQPWPLMTKLPLLPISDFRSLQERKGKTWRGFQDSKHIKWN